jgi:hypothetical protein
MAVVRDHRPPLDPADRYRMRRLTDDEMARLRALARNGATGPGKMLDALWDLILLDAEGVTVADAAARPGGYRVMDYSMAPDQAAELRDAAVENRKLPARTVRNIAAAWANWSPCDWVPEPTD